MKRTPFNALITQKTLEKINGNVELTELFLESLKDGEELNVPTKNVCARVSVPLADEIDSLCRWLGISKRRFLEMAFVEAVTQAKEIMDAEGLFEALDEQEEYEKKMAHQGEKANHNEEAA